MRTPVDTADCKPVFTIATMVRVRALSLLADIGINPDEVGRRQPIVIAVELTLAGGTVNAIADTIDYRRVADAAEKLAAVHIPLIENFAQRLCEICTAWPLVVHARVEIDKPFALTRGLAGVEVSLSRNAVS